jgi:hypothetical protein
MRRRVVKVVNGALKRLGMPKSLPILTYLGADSWRQVLDLLEAKRLCWNLEFPSTQMTPTNIDLDHIRPVRAFAHEGDGARTFLCNHYTNLQPLLHEDNAWKADTWSNDDEVFWHKHILFNKEFDSIYYPRAAAAQPSSEVLQALLSLGYSEKEALLAIKQISPDASVSEGIRQGLKYLSKV